MKLLKSKGVQTLLSSLICIVLGILIGYIVLLAINPAGASKAMVTILKNFLTFPNSQMRMEQFGTTLVKTAPLLMCSLSVLFAYKTGLFNIGVAGQYCIGIGACLFTALYLKWSWPLCLLAAIAAGALLGFLVGLLKSFCNVNEVISGIMLNWISLYITNVVLGLVAEPTSPATYKMKGHGKLGLLPKLGPVNNLFNGNQYLTVAVPIAIAIAIIVWIILEKTKLGYELKATGFNKNAAKYCGMAEKRNAILTLVIAGALAGLGASFYYQTGIEQWETSATSLPPMGFNGIAAAFLGGLNPIGTIFASFFLQHITEGGTLIDTNIYNSQISDLISSVIIYLCGFALFIKYTMNKIVAKSEERKALRVAAAASKETKEPNASDSRKGGDR